MAAVGAQSCFLRAAIQKAGRPKADLTDPPEMYFRTDLVPPIITAAIVCRP
jgi:hypothetical protein